MTGVLFIRGTNIKKYIFSYMTGSFFYHSGPKLQVSLYLKRKIVFAGSGGGGLNILKG